MKFNILLVGLAMGSIVGSTLSAEANVGPSQMILKPEFIFAPKSFDSNDNVQVVLAGSFTGYCVKLGTTRQSVDQKQKKILIEQVVSMTQNCQDLDMYVPYASVINLGTLSPGQYEVFAAGSKGEQIKMADLPVNQASENPSTQTTDERLYAPINTIDFKMKDYQGTAVLELKGVFTNSCLEMGSVEVYNKGGDVFEVLPIVKKGKSNCQQSVTPFAKTVTIRNFPKNDVLIHVRSMNGQSLNKVITSLDRMIHSF